MVAAHTPLVGKLGQWSDRHDGEEKLGHRLKIVYVTVLLVAITYYLAAFNGQTNTTGPNVSMECKPAY